MMRRRVYYDYHRPLLPHQQFTVILKRFPCKDSKPINPGSIDDLISSLPSPPIDPLVFPCRPIVAKLVFASRSDALDAVEFLWGRRLDGGHLLIAFIDSSNRLLKSEEFCRVKEVFVKHVGFLLDGEKTLKECDRKRDEIEREIKKRTALLRKPMRIEHMNRMREDKEGLQVELELINGRVEEFRVLMRSVLNYLKEGKDRVLDDGEVGVFRFGRDLSLGCFVRIHAVLMRECSRLRDGLPIYASRRKLLHTMFDNQVTVVIGETGSGKSTQLAQFIADSGLAAAELIVCTQPRKFAAISVAQRICEESVGCYNDDNFVVSYPTYSSSKELKSGITFTTDHCLLQHYMGKKNFEGISCIIVDEAHERSLNTDLLLALIKKELLQSNLRVIIMSATADASKLADYFYSCPTIFVKGRNFPVDIRYVPDVSTEAALSRIPRLILANCASYVSDVIMMVRMIHRTEEDGAILAF